MDWNLAIERNREALKRVLAMLVAMAGMGQSAVGSRQPEGDDGRPETELEPAAGSSNPYCLLPTAYCLPRHLHRAILSLLRPAESAVRRLVIVAARGIVLPRPRERAEQAKQSFWDKVGGNKPAPPDKPVQKITFPVTDPPRPPYQPWRPMATGVPRISVPGFTEPTPLPPPNLPDDPVDARRLGLRLDALARTLDDLPSAAKRFARWRRDALAAQEKRQDAKAADASRREAASTNNRAARPRRAWPLRLGRPPGHRARGRHEIFEILKETQGLAFWTLKSPDTS